MEITSRGINEEYWCAVKHALHLEGHLEENIANASRHNPEVVPELAQKLDKVREIRQSLVAKVLGTEPKKEKKINCLRCFSDLRLKLTESFIKQTKNNKTESYLTPKITHIEREKRRDFMRREEALSVLAGVVAAEALEQFGPQIDELIKIDLPIMRKASSWVDASVITAGLLPLFAPDVLRVDETTKLFLLTAAAATIVNRATKLLREAAVAAPLPTPAPVAAAPIRVAPREAPTFVVVD